MFDRECVLTWGVVQLELPSCSPFRRFKVSVSTVCLALATRLSPTSKENKWLATLLNQPQLRKRAKGNAYIIKFQCPGFWFSPFIFILFILFSYLLVLGRRSTRTQDSKASSPLVATHLLHGNPICCASHLSFRSWQRRHALIRFRVICFLFLSFNLSFLFSSFCQKFL